MSLASYLKKDIDTFLEEMEEKVAKGNPIREEEFSMFTIEKDYAELTQQAFDKNDTNSIEKLLKELQVQVNNDLLEEDLRMKIASVLEEVENIILKRIDEVDSPSLHGEAEKIIAKRKQESVTKQERDELFTKSITAIKNFLEKGEVDQAKLAYKRLVKDFKTYESGPEIEMWRKRIFTIYELINKTQSRSDREEDLIAEKQKMKIDSIKAKISHVIEGLGSIDPSVLENKLVEIKQDIIATRLSQDQGEAFLPILRTLVSKINFLKQSKEKEFMLEQKKILEKKEALKKREDANKLLTNEHLVVQEKNKEREQSLSQEEIATYEKAISFQNKGDFANAQQLYNDLLRKNPNNIRAQIRLMEIASKNKN